MNFFDEQFAKDGRYADVTEDIYQAFKRRSQQEGAATALTAEQQVRLAIVLQMQATEVSAFLDSLEFTISVVNLLTQVVLAGK